MRIYILFSDDPIFKPRLLYQVLLLGQGRYEFCGVGEVSAPKRGGLRKKVIYNIAFWGWQAFIYIAINHFYRKLLARLPLPWSVNGMFSLERVCEHFGVEFSHVDSVNSQEFLADLRAKEPDVILSFQHQIFKDEILALPRKACINCHPALLPKYRGVKPIFWAMLKGEDYFGVTVHTMTRDIDRGRIVSQVRVPLKQDHSLYQNYIAAYELSAVAILEALEKISDVTDFSIFPEIPNTSEYYHNPSKSDIKAFHQRGLRMF